MMHCSLPPPLTDDQISDALDGVADSAVAEHLARCPSCAARLDAARASEYAVRASLHRWDCPPSQRLGDYHLGMVDAAEQRAIAAHLAECASCRAEVEQLRLFLMPDQQPQPAPIAPQPARHTAPRGWIVARPQPRAAAPALRGAAGGPLTFTAGDATIFIDTQLAADGQVTLRGQLVADDQDRWTGALVEARQSGVLAASAAIDDLGGFVCAPLAAGATELRIHVDEAAGGVVVVLSGVE